jgi:nitrite transporter
MYHDEVTTMARAAKGKAAYLRESPFGYFVSAMLAGAYVGIGIVLIFSIGAPFAAIASPALKLLMGVSFGIALTLVIFAGSELFTGNNMIMTLGVLQREVGPSALASVWTVCWIGNLAGSMLLALVVVYSGSTTGAAAFVEKVSVAKMTAPAMELFLRAILCNWLVCLAIWTSARAKSDTAKCILIFWCLFAFIACGFEHSIANMTLLSLALFSQHGPEVTWMGFGNNMLYVTAGNILGGAVFVGGAYWFASHKKLKQAAKERDQS